MKTILLGGDLLHLEVEKMYIIKAKEPIVKQYKIVVHPSMKTSVE